MIASIVKYHDMNRAALIDQIEEARKTLKKLLALLQSAPVERDRFVSHLYQARREYRRTCETAGKSGKQIERCVISTFQVAESMGFRRLLKNPRTSRSCPPGDMCGFFNSLLGANSGSGSTCCELGIDLLPPIATYTVSHEQRRAGSL